MYQWHCPATLEVAQDPGASIARTDPTTTSYFSFRNRRRTKGRDETRNDQRLPAAAGSPCRALREQRISRTPQGGATAPRLRRAALLCVEKEAARRPGAQRSVAGTAQPASPSRNLTPLFLLIDWLVG